MRPFVIVLDGNDSVGKTGLLERLKKEIEKSGKTVKTFHFPSESLMESELTKKMIAGDPEAKRGFVTKVIGEALLALSPTPGEERPDVLLVDRLMISTLLYQGATDLQNDDLEAIELTSQILTQYSLMTQDLGLKFNYFVFATPVEVDQTERVVESENRRAYDAKKDKLKSKLEKIESMLMTGRYQEKFGKMHCLSPDAFFCRFMHDPEVEVKFAMKKKFTPAQMDALQEHRAQDILTMVWR